MKIEPMTSVPALEPGRMTVAWLIESGQPVDSARYNGAPHISSLVRDGIQLSLEEGGRIVTRTLDLEGAQALRDALDAHIRNITPNVIRAPRRPVVAEYQTWPPQSARRITDNPQA